MPLILPSQRLIRPNPLAYPAGATPGIDLSHPAANKLVVSALAQGRSFVNLASGVPLTVSGIGASSVTDGAIGRATYFSGVQTCSIAGPNTVTQNKTFAAILRPIAPGAGYAGIVNIYDGSGDEGLYLHNNGVVCYASSDNNPAMFLANNVPYFIAVSCSGSNFYYVVRNLNTGAVQTATITGSGPFVRPDSFIYVGEDGVNNASQSYVAAAAYSNSALSLPQLLQWAADPWSFWYPRRAIQYTTPATTTTTSGGARIRQRWNRSPLAYPAGAVPGVDWSHPAAQNLMVAIVPQGKGCYAIGGSVGNNVGTPFGVLPGGSVDSRLGPIESTNNLTQGFSFTRPIPATMVAGMGRTMAAFGTTTNAALDTCWVCDGNAEGFRLGPNAGTSSVFSVRLGGVTTFNSGVSISTNVPYFYAVTLIYDGSGNWRHNHVVRRLDTGAIFGSSGTATGTPITYTASSMCYGGGDNQPGWVEGSVGPAMVSSTILSQQQLLQWAADPWAFWYPNKTINLTSSAASAGASFRPVWVYEYNPPVLGTGNF